MEGYKILEHKAAGHDGTLTDNDGLLVFKPLNKQELEFYQQIQLRNQQQSLTEDQVEAENDDGDEMPLQTWMPTFLGVLNEGKPPANIGNITVLPEDSDVHLENIKNVNQSDLKNKDYLVLENLLSGYSKPNIMDIKLGKKLFDENATKEKIERMKNVSETTTSGSLGFRICGMQLQNNVKNKFDPNHIENKFDNEKSTEYIFVNKLYGRTRTSENIDQAINTFFDNINLSKKRQKLLKERFLIRLQLFYNTLLSKEVRMISSSLLFIFEGDQKRWDLKNDEEDIINNVFIEDDESDEDDEIDDSNAAEKAALKSPLSSMTLIDFAHSKLTPGEGYDENVIEGVESLIDIFTRLQEI